MPHRCLFQSNYQGRAEMGTMWGRDFHIKTSADGNQWHDALVADSATGRLHVFPRHCHRRHRQEAIRPDFRPATAMEATDLSRRAGQPEARQTAKLASVASDILTFTTDAVSAILRFAMRGHVDGSDMECNQIARTIGLGRMGYGVESAASQ